MKDPQQQSGSPPKIWPQKRVNFFENLFFIGNQGLTPFKLPVNYVSPFLFRVFLCHSWLLMNLS